jgi:ubiquitin-conjugating enzyme E2 O
MFLKDGSVEEKVPSIDLLPVHHMDELELFPGSFVVDANGELPL